MTFIINITFNTIYFVKTKTSNTIELSTTSGGLAIAFTGAPGAAVVVRKLAYDPATQQSAIIKAFLADQAGKNKISAIILIVFDQFNLKKFNEAS